MSTDNPVTDNTEKKRFEMNTGDAIAYVDYILSTQGVLFLTHTEVPVELEGRGIASAMLNQVFRMAEKRELSIAPICPFVKAWLSRNPEWKRILNEHHRM
jgi:uncharacterized protein